MNHRVLIVEDDPLSAEFMKLYLEGVGYVVATATSSAQAHTQFKSFGPSVVVTDIQLGDGSGLELAKAFKRLGVQKIIAVSGLSQQQLQDKYQAITAFDRILTKPIELAQLAATIEAELLS